MLSRNLKILIAIILVVTLPSIAALSWYVVTKDPSVRPLGITKRALEDHGTDEGSSLTVLIRFDPDEDAHASSALGEKIAYALGAKGVIGDIERHPVPGKEMTVTYLIGASTIGPYLASDASSGINAAVAAYRMIAPAKAPGT